MSRFWDAAVTGAGHEFGARYYRWFVAVRVLKRIAPALILLVGIGGAVVAGIVGYRWLSPDWAAVRHGATSWLPGAGAVILWALVGLAGLALFAGLVAVVARNWWRWSLILPMWMRRY